MQNVLNKQQKCVKVASTAVSLFNDFEREKEREFFCFAERLRTHTSACINTRADNRQLDRRDHQGYPVFLAQPLEYIYYKMHCSVACG